MYLIDHDTKFVLLKNNVAFSDIILMNALLAFKDLKDAKQRRGRSILVKNTKCLQNHVYWTGVHRSTTDDLTEDLSADG